MNLLFKNDNLQVFKAFNQEILIASEIYIVIISTDRTLIFKENKSKPICTIFEPLNIYSFLNVENGIILSNSFEKFQNMIERLIHLNVFE